MISIKISDGYVKKVLLYVTFTGSYCYLKGKLIDFGNMFGLQDSLLEDKMGNSLFTKARGNHKNICGILISD